MVHKGLSPYTTLGKTYFYSVMYIGVLPILNQQCWETLAAKIKNTMINRFKFMSIIYTHLLFSSVFYLDHQCPTELSKMMEMV